MKNSILLCILFTWPLFLFAECSSDSLILPPYRWIQLGNQYKEKSRQDSALYCYRRAASMYREMDSLNRWLRVQYDVSFYLAFPLNRPADALATIDESLLQMTKWRTPKGEQENEQYCSLHLIRAHICKQKTGDYISVKKSLEKAYQIFRDSLSGRYNKRAEYLFFQLGNNYVRLLEYQAAQLAFERGIQYSKQFVAPQVAKYSDYASLFITKREYQKALSVVYEGLNYPGIPQEDSIFLFLAKAECLVHLQQLDEALNANKEVELILARPLEKPSKQPEYEIGLYENYGMIAIEQKNYERALSWYNKALLVAQNYTNSTARNIAFSHVQIADILRQDGRIEASLQSYQEALHTLLRNFKAPPSQNPPDSILFAENILYRALEGKALCFQVLGDLAKSLECYELIPSVETKLRTTHLYESSSLSTVENSRDRFEKAIAIAWQLYEKTKENQYAERAFDLSEQTRGMLLLKSMVQSQTQATFRLPDSLRERDNEIRIQLSEYEHQIAELSDSSQNTEINQLHELIRQRDELKHDQAAFLEQLSAIFPGYAQISDALRPIQKDSVPAILRPNQAFIDYFLSEKAAYIFLIDPKGTLTWHKVDLPPHFRDSTIQQFVEYLANGKGKGDAASKARDRWFKQTAANLYTLLLAPVLSASPKNLDALVIAPDDVLAFLPFELLITESSQAAWPDLPFVLHQYSISYAYSATLLDRQQTNMREHSTTDRVPFAGFAPVYDNDRDPQTGDLLYPITGMDKMVDKVQQMLGGKVFKGDKANESEFGLTAPMCRVLLLAMHGFANESEPTLSRLLFGDPTKTGNPDNVLYTNELQITYLPVDLVVLNACYTGFGKLHRGEGVYSLTRALTSAGVPSTVMSIWQLSGASSPVLIETFFHNIKNRMPKDVALQQAKIELLRNPEYDSITHPTFWGGLLATGDMTALKF